MNTEAVKVQALSKTFSKGTVALQNVCLSIGPGEMVALIGASGAGKSTLLRHSSGDTVVDIFLSVQI